MEWHSLPIEELFKKLESSSIGITEEEAKRRIKVYGENLIEIERKVSPFKIFLNQFKSFLVVILIIAAFISYAIGFIPGEEASLADTILISTILITNAIFGFFQDYKAEKTLEALKKMAAPKAKVLRNGKVREVKANEVVPGDVLILEEGDIVPADARIIESNDLEIDESILTGESFPIRKKAGILKEDVPLAERSNMVYMHTNVVRGDCKALVVATSLNTEIGKISMQMQRMEKRPAPFKSEIDTLGKNIGIGILLIIAFIATIQFLLKITSPLNILLTSIALAVAAIPEGLPAIVTFTLALGTRRMAKENALIRRLSVIEDLGFVDVICTDKTGTLTENKMTVRKIYFNGKIFEVSGVGYSLEGKFLYNGKEVDPKELLPLLKAGLNCNNVIEEDGKYIGNPTEIALVIAAKKGGIKEKEKRIDEISFSSERKLMTTIHKNKKYFSYTKGAPEIILEKCDKILEDGEVKELDKEKKKEILKITEKFASQGLRVLGFAYKEFDSYENKKEVEKEMIFLGLQAMMDPPRKEVKDAIKMCKEAGIKVIMITGDNKVTAEAIAKEIGIGTKSIEGNELDKMSQKELENIIEKIDIFARAVPSHKVRILKALQAKGYRVAMTGDGVNDAPALKSADVGIAMGIRGTEVAKEASDMVLLDDDFKTIVDAIKQGRRIFDNIRKFVNYLLTCNFAEIFVIFFTSLFGYLPITAAQLLWINLLTDGGPALALGIDPPNPGIMKRRPRKKGEKIIDKRLASLILAIGIKKTCILLSTFFVSLYLFGLNIATTMTFTGFILYEFVRIATIRYGEKLSIFSNSWLILALIISVLLQLFVIYSPLNTIFGVIPLELIHWSLLLTFVMVGLVFGILITKIIITII